VPTESDDRRRSARWVPGPTDALSRIRLRAGRELAVVNVSAGGALVEGTTRLLPGTHVEVHVTGAQGRVLVRARVVRCAVWTVTADVVTYRGALAFSAPVDLVPDEAAAHEIGKLLRQID
jgi:PilZ domain-containing protein